MAAKNLFGKDLQKKLNKAHRSAVRDVVSGEDTQRHKLISLTRLGYNTLILP